MENRLAPSLLSFGLGTGVRSHRPEKRKIPINPVFESLIRARPIRIFLFSGGYRPEKSKIPINPVCESLIQAGPIRIFLFSGRYRPEKRKIPISPVCERI